MTPKEWREAYQDFIGGDDVVYLSEHRGSWSNAFEFEDITNDAAIDFVLFPISITRSAARDAAFQNQYALNIAVHHIVKIKPFYPSPRALYDLRRSKYGGLVIDDDYPDGTAKALALDLHNLTGAKMYAMGLENRTAGFSAATDNLPPNGVQIAQFIRNVMTV